MQARAVCLDEIHVIEVDARELFLRLVHAPQQTARSSRDRQPTSAPRDTSNKQHAYMSHVRLLVGAEPHEDLLGTSTNPEHKLLALEHCACTACAVANAHAWCGSVGINHKRSVRTYRQHTFLEEEQALVRLLLRAALLEAVQVAHDDDDDDDCCSSCLSDYYYRFDQTKYDSQVLDARQPVPAPVPLNSSRRHARSRHGAKCIPCRARSCCSRTAPVAVSASAHAAAALARSLLSLASTQSVSQSIRPPVRPFVHPSVRRLVSRRSLCRRRVA